MPNRDLICYEYHRDIVLDKIAELRNKYGANPSGMGSFRTQLLSSKVASLPENFGQGAENLKQNIPNIRQFKMCFM
jgi:hypothetical protein